MKFPFCFKKPTEIKDANNKMRNVLKRKLRMQRGIAYQGFKECVFVNSAKNTLLQTAFSAIFPTGISPIVLIIHYIILAET